MSLLAGLIVLSYDIRHRACNLALAQVLATIPVVLTSAFRDIYCGATGFRNSIWGRGRSRHRFWCSSGVSVGSVEIFGVGENVGEGDGASLALSEGFDADFSLAQGVGSTSVWSGDTFSTFAVAARMESCASVGAVV
jgi:hypothetical protein